VGEGIGRLPAANQRPFQISKCRWQTLLSVPVCPTEPMRWPPAEPQRAPRMTPCEIAGYSMDTATTSSSEAKGPASTFRLRPHEGPPRESE